MEQIRLYVMNAYEEGKVVEIEKSLENYQAIVNDNISLLWSFQFDDGIVDIYMGDEAYFKDHRFNRVIQENDSIDNHICAIGNCFAVGLDYETGESISLTDSQIEKLEAMFKYPEFLVQEGGTKKYRIIRKNKKDIEFEL